MSLSSSECSYEEIPVEVVVVGWRLYRSGVMMMMMYSVMEIVEISVVLLAIGSLVLVIA